MVAWFIPVIGAVVIGSLGWKAIDEYADQDEYAGANVTVNEPVDIVGIIKWGIIGFVAVKGYNLVRESDILG